MRTNHETVISEDRAKKQIKAIREYDAPVELVWKAWTDSKWLDKWWAPKPWKARTKSIDLKAGGRWLYAMVGPNGEEQWDCINFKTVNPPKHFTTDTYFSDENGVRKNDMPAMHWDTKFSSTGSGTKVEALLTFDSEEEMKKIIDMGFKDGFTMAQNNLDELLQREAAMK